MRRTCLLCTALALGLLGSTGRLYSQNVQIQAANGWTFTFTGNVNAFLVFEKETEADPGEARVVSPFALVGEGRQGSAIRTGLLPAFATFEAAGREGQTDLMVHFGFAPQIQTPFDPAISSGHDNFNFTGDDTQAGAQIDMRQVYLKVSGPWGSILAGREIGVYQRQNILNDQTLFGTGPTGGNFGNPGGTTLGRIGFGYVYPNFVAQLTYASPGDRPGQINIGLFNPSTNNGFDELVAPRLEAEFTYNYEGFSGWAGALVQNQKDTDPAIDESSAAWGASGGLKYSTETFSVVGSGYYGQGIGTTLMFLGGRSDDDDPATGERSTELRKSFGGIAQASVTPQGSKVTLAGSFGASIMQEADGEAPFEISNNAVVGGVYYQATKSLKVVGEGTYSWTDDDDDLTEKNSSVVVSGGLMLFF